MTVACIGSGYCEMRSAENELPSLFGNLVENENARLFLMCGKGRFIEACTFAVEMLKSRYAISVKRTDMPNLLAAKYGDGKTFREAEIRTAVSLADAVVVCGEYLTDEISRYAVGYAKRTRRRIITVPDRNSK